MPEGEPIIDTGRPHTARMYDYYLGGGTHYAADAAAAEEVLRLVPPAGTIARAQRDLMRRVTRHLTAEAGIDQYLDIGAGIPLDPNLHEIAQQAIPSTRVVYVDNDPIVRAYAGTLLAGRPEGSTRFLLADVRDVERIHASPEMATLDLTRPVALTVLGVVQFLPEDLDVADLLRRLMAPLPPGSRLALSTVTSEWDPPLWERVAEAYRRNGMHARTYSRAETVRLFDGLELVDPGVVPSHRWRPGPGQRVPPGTPRSRVHMLAGVARKR